MPCSTVIAMLIDCDRCAMRSIACHDCVVTFLLGDAPHGHGADLTSDEVAAVEVLADQGVVPPLRLQLLSDNRHIADKKDNSSLGRAASR